MDKALDLRIRGREFESRYGQEFSFCNSRFSILAARVRPCMKSAVTYSELIPCFGKRYARKNMAAVSSGI